MDKVLRTLLLVAAVALATFAPSAFADSLVTVDGSYATSSYGYGIPPYGGTLDGQTAAFYCVDFTHDIGAGDYWWAVVTPVGSSSSVPYLSGKTIDGVDDYVLFAWLISQMTPADQAQYQWAIWSVTDGAVGDPFGDPTLLFSNAVSQLEAAHFTGQGWEILTPDARRDQYGQEFLVQTPEPASLLLLAMGLGALLFLKRRSQLQG